MSCHWSLSVNPENIRKLNFAVAHFLKKLNHFFRLVRKKWTSNTKRCHSGVFWKRPLLKISENVVTVPLQSTLPKMCFCGVFVASYHRSSSSNELLFLSIYLMRTKWMICDNPNLRHPINNIKNKTSLVLNIIKIWRQDLHRSFTRDNFI